MSRSSVKLRVRVRNNTNKVGRLVNDVLNRRFDAVSQKLHDELKKVLSAKGPSKPGQPPAITQTPHSYRTPGGLMKSIGWMKDNTKNTIRRRIGSTLKRGYWLELGVAGGVIIRPKRAKALLVPIDAATAARLMSKRRRKNNKGGRSKGRRSGIRNNKLIGVIRHSSNGQWYALMRWVVQGPIAPRPWLKPTMNKNLKGIGLTLSQRIN